MSTLKRGGDIPTLCFICLEKNLNDEKWNAYQFPFLTYVQLSRLLTKTQVQEYEGIHFLGVDSTLIILLID